MKNKKIAVRILLILISMLCILLPTKVSAMSQAEAGQYIANYAINFFNSRGDATKYYADGNFMETRGYSTQTGEPWPDTNMYMFDCMGFLSMVVRQSTGVIIDNIDSGLTSYIWPSGLDKGEDPSNRMIVEKVTSGDLQPGDLIRNSHHVMIFVGEGKIIHCDGGVLNGNRGGQYKGGLSYETIEQYGQGYNSVYRLRQDVLDGKTGNAGGDMTYIPGGGGIGALVDKIKNWFSENLLEEQEEFPIGTPLSDEEYNKLYYKGIATLKGTTTEEEDTDDWVFPSLADITDWIGGFIIMPVRAAVTGWANVVQIVVSQYINYTAGEETAEGITDIMSNMSEYMKKSITLEKIVYNEIPLFDVNVFSGDEAGGKTVESDTLVSAIRKLVAEWYYVFRLIAIIGLLLILIYIGIKMAISTAAEEKAKYKTLFVNWLVAFVIVFFMQYFMVFVMQINQALIDIFKGIGKSLNLYETVRTLTWEVKMSTGIIATALYVMLIYYMLKFVVMYFKRLFIVVVLIVLAPLVAAKYAIDKLSGSKDSQTLKTWGQEYVFNVLMQSIHAFTYTIFTAVSLDIAKATTNSTSDVSYIFANIVLVIIFFRFMIESEKILKKMMKLVTGPGADFGDANSTSIRDLFGLTILTQLMRELKPFYKMTKFVGKNINKRTHIVSNVKRPFRKVSNYIQDSYVLYNTEVYKNRLKDINFSPENSYSNLNLVGIDAKLDKVLRQDFINRKELLKDYIGTDFNVILGMGKTFIGLPIFLAESPLVGAELMLVGLRTVRVAMGKPVKGYRKPDKMTSKWYKSPVARGTYKTMATILSGGTVNVAHRIYERYKNENELLNMNLNQVETLLMARNVELNMKNNLTFLRDKYFKGLKNGANSVQKNIAEINEKELLLNIMESQLSIPETEIYNEIKEYKKQTGRYTLNNNDIKNIMNNIRNKENQKLQSGEEGVKLTNKVNQNMNAELISGIVNNVEEKVDDYSSLQLSQESLDIMSNNLKSKIEELEGKENKTEQEIEETNALKLAYYMIKQKRVQNIDENEINELDEMSNNMQNIIKESEENSKEDTIRTVVYNVLNERKQKLENDIGKLGEDFTKKEEETIKQPEESKNDLKQIKQKLKERLDELNKKEDLDEMGVQEKEATQKAFNIVQYDVEINESNKKIEKSTREIAEKILKNHETVEEAYGVKGKNTTLNVNKQTSNTQETSKQTTYSNVNNETSKQTTHSNVNNEDRKNENYNSNKNSTKENKIEDILSSIEKGTKNNISIDEIGKKDQYNINKAIINSMSESILGNEVSKLSNKDLGRLIKKSTRIEGSIEKSEVSDKYKDIVNYAEKLRDLNDESEEKYGKKIYTTKELIEGIRKGIRGKEKNRDDEEE